MVKFSHKSNYNILGLYPSEKLKKDKLIFFKNYYKIYVLNNKTVTLSDVQSIEIL